MPPNPNDKLFKCANKYRQLLNNHVTFDFEIFNHSIRKYSIVLDESQFKHLSGVHHLDDLPYFKNIRSKILLKDTMHGNTSYSQNSFHECMASSKVNQLYDGFSLLDRLNIMEHFQQIMEGINPNNYHQQMEVFYWKNGSDSNGSVILADFLFQFRLSSGTPCQVNGTPYPYINFFFISDKNGVLSGVSAFPSNKDYSLGLEPVSKILSLEEHSNLLTVSKKLIQCNSEERNKYIQKEEEQKLKDIVSSHLDKLDKRREKMVEKPKEKNRERYEDYIKNAILNDKTPDEVLQRIERQLSDILKHAEPEFQKYIENEISLISQTLTDRMQKHQFASEIFEIKDLQNITPQDDTILWTYMEKIEDLKEKLKNDDVSVTVCEYVKELMEGQLKDCQHDLDDMQKIIDDKKRTGNSLIKKVEFRQLPETDVVSVDAISTLKTFTERLWNWVENTIISSLLKKRDFLSNKITDNSDGNAKLENVIGDEPKTEPIEPSPEQETSLNRPNIELIERMKDKEELKAMLKRIQATEMADDIRLGITHESRKPVHEPENTLESVKDKVNHEKDNNTVKFVKYEYDD